MFLHLLAFRLICTAMEWSSGRGRDPKSSERDAQQVCIRIKVFLIL